METVYKVSEFKKLLAESSNEFKAKLGSGVESKEKEQNGKAYKDAKKRANDYDGGLSNEVGEKKAEYKKEDFNKTTLDYTPDNATPEYKKRVHAQVNGYTSEAEKNNGIEKIGDFSENEKIYDELKKSGEEMQDNAKTFKKSGLQAREWPDEVFDRENMYESKDGFDMRKMLNHMAQIEESVKPTNEKKNVKTIAFKKTEFLNEGHMINKIPDDFKKEGTAFRMKDKCGNTYLIEWKNNKANILEHSNKEGFNESMSRMQELFDYKTSDTSTNSSDRLNENEEKFSKTLDKMRKIIK